MTRIHHYSIATAFAIIALTALAVVRLRFSQRLGEPAVRMVGLPVVTESGNVARTNSVFLPQSTPGYDVAVAPMDDIEISFLPPDTSFGRRRFTSIDGNLSVQTTVVLMRSDRTSMHRPEFCLSRSGWNIKRQVTEAVRLAGQPSRDVAVRRLDVTQFGKDETGRSVQAAGVYAFFFVAPGLTTASPLTRTLWMMRSLFESNVLQRWAYVSYFARCEPGDEEATFQKMANLIGQTAPEFIQFDQGALP